MSAYIGSIEHCHCTNVQSAYTSR